MLTRSPASALDDLPRAERADGSVNRRFVRVLSPGVLVCRPNTLQFGHLAMELLMALDEARRRDHAIYLLKAGRVINPALFELESEDVRILRAGPARALWLRLTWGRSEIADRVQRVSAAADRAVREELSRQIRRHAADTGLPPGLRVALKRLDARLVPPRRPRHAGRPYMRRQNMRQPVRVTMSAPALERAARAASAIGIPVDGPLVTVHAREAGFKRGREVHENASKLRPRDDSLRNARIETYFPAIDHLVAQGYTVVRLGDSTMTPVRRAGVIDLATDPRRIPELDVYCLIRSRFTVVGESGPGQAALLTNTPTLTVNATDPISSYPVRADGLYLLKRAEALDTGGILSLREMLSESYLRWLRYPSRFRYIDNSPEEILEAVLEMQAVTTGRLSESPRQVVYRQLATEAGDTLRDRLRYVRKFGTDEGFLGDGRIGRAFVEAHL